MHCLHVLPFPHMSASSNLSNGWRQRLATKPFMYKACGLDSTCVLLQASSAILRPSCHSDQLPSRPARHSHSHPVFADALPHVVPRGERKGLALLVVPHEHEPVRAHLQGGRGVGRKRCAQSLYAPDTIAHSAMPSNKTSAVTYCYQCSTVCWNA